MKKNYFIALFVGTHILFIVLQIHKHNTVMKLSFTKQKHEQKLATLTQEKQEKVQQLYVLKDRTSVKKFAQQKLGMKKITLNQVKKIHHDN